MGEQLESFVQHGTKEEKIRISADDILNAIAEGRDVDIEYAAIRGELDVMTIADRLEVDEDGAWNIKGSVKIENSEIHGDVDFSSITFDGRVSFVSSVFDGEVAFSLVTFNKEVDFSSVTFSRKVDFPSVDFNEKGNFSSATFSGTVSFVSATFSKAAVFYSSTFGDIANFCGTVFDSHISFWLAAFNKSAIFWEATFNKETDFNGVVLNQPASFMGVRFREKTVFVGLWNDILCPTTQFVTAGRVKLTRKVVTDFSSLDTATVIDGSSNPYLKRYIDDEQWIRSWRERGHGRESIFFVWELMSHCGRSIGLWAIWSFLFVLLFAIVYTPAPGWMPEWWFSFWQEHGAVFGFFRTFREKGSGSIYDSEL